MGVRRTVLASMLAAVLGSSLLAGCAGLESTTAGDGAASADQQAPAGSCGGPVETVQDVEAIISEPAGCPGSVNTYWTGELGRQWTAPRYIAYRDGEIPPIACAAGESDPAAFASNALYCTADDTIAYSVDFMTELHDVGGPSYPMYVIMHELAHRASTLSGRVGVVSRAEENQADCLAGSQARLATDADRLDLGDAFSGALLFFNLGDTRDRGWFDRETATSDGAHGTPRQRAQAFAFGYLRDNDTCFRLGESPTGSVTF
ncbi:metalloprotease [Parafrankia colletiae]|uniref:Metalloprotease n=1 Tax=Parafrankia colletiae TaxID=573497 RepID=A0A1S1Q7W0_9ACTN|nr:neutral zinc metallopeptidase [Parafrankia colletiae]OHV29679.1 metalloprotease [Parafrankia colletiae]